MQNTVNQRKRNSVNFFYLQCVTNLRSGNNPANGLVTEILQYFTIFCFLAKWQNLENQLILNRLRYQFNVLFLLALEGITHVARHTFATYLLNKDVPIESVSRALGHSNIKMTQHYARMLGKKVIDDMSKLL